jgi:hypothetical protein
LAWTEKYVIAGGLGSADGSSEANAWDWAAAITHSTTNTGIRYNVKASTKASGATSLSFSGVGTTTAPNWWRGYKTAIGDMDGHPSSTRTAGTDFPLVTFTSGAVTVGGAHQIFSNIEFRGTAPGTRLVGVTGSKVKFVRCRFDNQEAASSSYAVRSSSDGVCYTDCWFKATSTASNVCILEERTTVTGCVFRGGGNGCMADLTGGGVIAFLDCAFDANGDDSIESVGAAGNPLIVDGCTFYNPGGHGVNVTTTVPEMLLVRNCLFHTITVASKYAVNMPSGSNVPHLIGNAWYNVTTRTNNVTEALEFFGITESSDPCTNAAGHDFSLVSGAASKGAALPQLFENESYKSFRDAGAVQRQEAGGGGGVLVNPGMVGGWE